MFSVSLTPAEVTRLECPRQDQSVLGRGHGLGLAEPLGPCWEGVIGTLAHGGHSSPFQDGFPGPLGPWEKDFPPRFRGVLSPGVLVTTSTLCWLHHVLVLAPPRGWVQVREVSPSCAETSGVELI